MKKIVHSVDLEFKIVVKDLKGELLKTAQNLEFIKTIFLSTRELQV